MYPKLKSERTFFCVFQVTETRTIKMAVSEDGSYAVPEPGEVLSFENIESDIKLDCQMVAKIPDKSDKEVGMGHRMLKFVKSVALPYSSRRQSVVENGVKYNIKHLSESFRWVRIFYLV